MPSTTKLQLPLHPRYDRYSRFVDFLHRMEFGMIVNTSKIYLVTQQRKKGKGKV
jgi:hypothetical protein